MALIMKFETFYSKTFYNNYIILFTFLCCFHFWNNCTVGKHVILTRFLSKSIFSPNIAAWITAFMSKYIIASYLCKNQSIVNFCWISTAIYWSVTTVRLLNSNKKNSWRMVLLLIVFCITTYYKILKLYILSSGRNRMHCQMNIEPKSRSFLDIFRESYIDPSASSGWSNLRTVAKVYVHCCIILRSK